MSLPKFDLVDRSIDKLTPYSGNARTHSEAQIAQLAISITEFGFTNPVLIDESDVIIAGEGRVLAAKSLNIETVPCIMLVGLSEDQKAAYVIADNRLAEGSEWDFEALCIELMHLADQDLDLNLVGFDEVEVLHLLNNFGPMTLDEGDLEQLAADEAVMEAKLSAPPSSPQAQAGLNALLGKAPNTPPSAPTPTDWSGMPEFEQKEDKPHRTLIVHFNDQGAVDAFVALVGQQLTEKTKYIWFPKQVKVPVPKVAYV